MRSTAAIITTLIIRAMLGAGLLGLALAKLVHGYTADMAMPGWLFHAALTVEVLLAAMVTFAPARQSGRICLLFFAALVLASLTWKPDHCGCFGSHLNNEHAIRLFTSALGASLSSALIWLTSQPPITPSLARFAFQPTGSTDS